MKGLLALAALGLMLSQAVGAPAGSAAVPGNAMPGREREQFGLSPFPPRELNDGPAWVTPQRSPDAKRKCRTGRARHRGRC